MFGSALLEPARLIDCVSLSVFSLLMCYNDSCYCPNVGSVCLSVCVCLCVYVCLSECLCVSIWLMSLLHVAIASS